MKKISVLLIINLFCISLSFGQRLYEKYKNCNLKSSIYDRFSDHKEAMKVFQQSKIITLKVDSLDFVAGDILYCSDDGVQFVCKKSDESITFEWGWKWWAKQNHESAKKFDLRVDPPCLLITYSHHKTILIFCLMKNGGGGFFKGDEDGSVFVPGALDWDVSACLANKDEINILRKRIIDICVALRVALPDEFFLPVY